VPIQWDLAYLKCCSLGMKLLSFEMDHKYASLVKSFTSNIIHGRFLNKLHVKLIVCACADTSLPAPTSGTYWTSGTDQGRPGSYAWCSANKIFYNSKWAPGHPGSNAQAQCVAVNLDAQTAQLEATACTNSYSFICEVGII
jgi:hypothetical protein